MVALEQLQLKAKIHPHEAGKRPAMRSQKVCRLIRFRHVLTLVFLLAAALQIPAGPCRAKFITIEQIPVGFAEDPRYGEIIREIQIEGNKHTREGIIRAALKSRVGHPYTEADAKKDLLWVSRLGSYTSVSFRVDPVEDGIALTVIVVEATRWLPSLKLKITDENGLEIGPAVNSFNLLGTTARLSAYAMFGGATNYGVRYMDPVLHVRDWRAGYSLFYFHRERTNKLLNFEETSDELFFEFGQPDTDDMSSGLRFRYLYLKADRDSITLSPDNKDKMSSFGLYVKHDSRNGVYPTDGWFIDAEVSKYGLFGGELSDFWRFDTDARLYKLVPGLGPKHSVAFYYYSSLVFGELGTTIPYHQEFYLGGTNAVRGWELGVIHGQNQWLNTVEYWYRLMEQKKWKVWFIKWRMGFQIGVFGDLGTAWTEYEDLRENWIWGWGGGFRLSLPVITVVRLDVGYGPSGGVVRFHVGGAEKAAAQKSRVR